MRIPRPILALIDLVWPQLDTATEIPRVLPPIEEGSRVPAIVYGEVRAAYDSQRSAARALDDKASTVIAATLVVLGLTLPNLTLKTESEMRLFTVLAVVVGYGLACAVRAYNVERFRLGLSAASAARALREWKNAEAGLAALTLSMIRASAHNRPLARRKARFVRRALVSQALSALLLAGLFSMGSFA